MQQPINLFVSYAFLLIVSCSALQSTDSPTPAGVPQLLVPGSMENMVLIPGGKFPMGGNDGEDDERPVHEVTLSSFYLAKYEVTIGEFKQFIEDTGYRTDADKEGASTIWDGKSWTKIAGVNWKNDPEGKIRPVSEHNHPVIHVSWNDATEYCKWLSKKTGQNFHLPTEAQWEYSAGNGSKHTQYSWGNGPPKDKQSGNVGDETTKRKFLEWRIFSGYNDDFLYTAPVGSFFANEFGVFDLSGNVWEWCQDYHDKNYYQISPSNNPQGPDTGPLRVMRGGSWRDGPTDARVAYRGYGSPHGRYVFIGFRIARKP